MRIGLLGAGRIGAFHGAVLSRHPDVDELVVGDADPGRATALAERLGATAVADVGAVLGAGLDGVVIATATAAHAELVVRAADKGVPTFCEKPIALDVEGTVAVLARTAAAGVPLHVGFQRRFDRDYLAARDSVESGRLGDLYASDLAGGAWTPARNLGPLVNTAFDEYHPTLSRDRRELFFVRRVPPARGNFYHVDAAALGLR